MPSSSGWGDLILEKAREIPKSRVCDNCLGRQFAQLGTGMTNRERGKALRTIISMESAQAPKEPAECAVCSGLFSELGKWAGKAAKQLGKTEFSTFVVGTKLSRQLLRKEEALWESIGIEHCEPMKAELNRELGKLIYERVGKDVDEKNPDVNVILNLESQRIELRISPIFFYGKYKKLVRGIPQTKWEKYRQSVEGIIAKPFMKHSRGSAHSMHGMGREDVDARCLDWRPFVLEISEPKKRNLDLVKIRKEVGRGRKVAVDGLRPSNRKEVAKVKESRPEKTYRVVVVFEKPAEKLSRLGRLRGRISQKTPERVAHRRADRVRRRSVRSIKWKKKGARTLELEIRGEAGLYVKELITGDNGRTSPSVSSLLRNQARVKSLDVVKIHL